MIWIMDQYAMRSLTIFALSPLLSSPKCPVTRGLVWTQQVWQHWQHWHRGVTLGRENGRVVRLGYQLILVIAEVEKKKINAITTLRYYEMIRNT